METPQEKVLKKAVNPGIARFQKRMAKMFAPRVKNATELQWESDKKNKVGFHSDESSAEREKERQEHKARVRAYHEQLAKENK